MDPVVLQLDPLSSASPNTNEYATIKLIEIADEVLKNNKPVDNSIILLYFKKTFVMVGLGFTVLLFVGYIYTGTSLYEGIWLFLVILLNGCNTSIIQGYMRVKKIQQQWKCGEG